MMSSAAPSRQPQLGDRKPAELSPAGRGEFWMKCDLALSPKCEGERWARLRGAESQKMMKAAGWIKPCEPCSYRARGEQKMHKEEVTMPCGSTAHLRVRTNHGKEIEVVCAICGTPHFMRMDCKDAYGKGSRRLGFCDDCRPWVLVALKPEEYRNPFPGRDAIYAKIKRLREALASDAPPAGGGMPFWALLKHYNTAVNANRPYFDRLFALYFDEQPISALDSASVIAFCDFLRSNASRNGVARATHTVDLILLRLRHIFEHARWERWIKENPVPKRAELLPEVLRRKKRPGPEKGIYAFITWENLKEAFKQVDGFPTKPKIAKALGVSVSGIDKWMQREPVNWRQVQQRFINTY